MSHLAPEQLDLFLLEETLWIAAALSVAAEAARRVNVPFLVVDVALTQGGEWLVIEVNDGQESGYAGISPAALWRRVIEIERLHDNRTPATPFA